MACYDMGVAAGELPTTIRCDAVQAVIQSRVLKHVSPANYQNRFNSAYERLLAVLMKYGDEIVRVQVRRTKRPGDERRDMTMYLKFVTDYANFEIGSVMFKKIW